MFENRITRLFSIDYPIVQAGMVWASGWKLASAVSEAGGLGVIGSGSMYPDVLREHIRKCKQATSRPFAVNIPLIYPDIEKHVDIIIEEGVKIVFTSAGNPNIWTRTLKDNNIKVVHVVGSSKFALKAQDAGCDAIVAEGFEAGGHNGREETTTFVLTPSVRNAVSIPILAAGGIVTGRQLFAAMVLGAEGGQIGTRFIATTEASSHIKFKQIIINAAEGDTHLSLKKLMPVRLFKNHFFNLVNEAETRGADSEELKKILGRGRAKIGMFEGNIDEGELEIGQGASLIKSLKPAMEIVKEIWDEFCEVLGKPLEKY